MSTTRPWNYHSHVAPCDQCEGIGSYPNGRGLGGNDPDSWDIECDECEGHGHSACKVCGFDHIVPGYDCLACSTVEDVPTKLLTDEFRADFVQAVFGAFDAARLAHAADRIAA